HVANQLNLSLEQYENYEEGEVLPTIFELIDLSILYQVSLDYLVGRTEE
ncbi:MAG: helix-turn-helix transcriptional regulator, partial [Enterococcus raffinosus]|nr:helix-turn-helix transcriptional regulator [Enterococcus raffinosus]